MPYVAKCRFCALMIRRIIDAIYDPTRIDDKDYYGNKRLELAGSLISLLFEDKFKEMCYNLKLTINKELPKYKSKDYDYDAVNRIRTDTITFGIESAMKSGNWNIKRFGMDR